MQKSRRDFFGSVAWPAALWSGFSPRALTAAESEAKPYRFPRCRLTPEPEHQTAFELAGKATARWHFGPQYPRPFFFPFAGPCGASLTRLGHPGAPDHDHHRSIWFGHHDVAGVDFWSENTEGRIRQKHWLCYEDGEAQCVMAVRLGWFAGEPVRELMEQTLVAVARPREAGEHTLELQSTFRPVAGPALLGRTNFGFLAVRVAKSISEFFGDGRLTDSEGRSTEADIFGKRACWVDYSGPVADGVVEGVTYFDHPQNPGAPTHWHVREDGWMGASFCMKEGWSLEPEQPLKLRYLLHAHSGRMDKDNAAALLADFTAAPFYDVVPAETKHRQFELRPPAER
ncbi:MAG TPA: PmoA family protein [Verrucomicrobiales bacterium]|nr:PmoA family protein [Verrucomicrobiales bacterium]